MTTSVSWITWEKQVRNRNLSIRFGAQLHEVVSRHKSIIRYAFCTWKTLNILWCNKKNLVVVQNPSIALATTAIAFKFLFNCKIVIDAHNAAVVNGNKFVQAFNVAVIKNADFVIVSNYALAARVTAMGGRALALPDPLPRFSPPDARAVGVEERSVLFICSWAADEPYFEVFKTAQILSDVTFYVSGASKGRELLFGEPLPANVILTGYLDDHSYERMLFDVKVIIDLTTREDCLVCGAYEAVAAGTPLITSNSRALQAYFEQGCLFCDNTVNSIATCVVEAIDNNNLHRTKIQELKTRLEHSWAGQLNSVKSALGI